LIELPNKKKEKIKNTVQNNRFWGCFLAVTVLQRLSVSQVAPTARFCYKYVYMQFCTDGVTICAQLRCNSPRIARWFVPNGKLIRAEF